ncbi:MAG: sigma-70 family RNA polymerase sigma factor [Leptonema illini]|uniref:Sigma-70 family RNA polymerase sigma factor n=1 Tax=Leptonema illini TaxID=183 RepID=A0A833LVD1_9LEPT|nr:MAG: sigma-70 family RNA polymerase sigma factor [Leptonema illini]
MKHFNTLYQANYAMVHGLVTRMVGDGDVVKDLVQEVFVKLYLQLQAGERIEYPKTWLYRVATHGAINHLSRTRKHLAMEEAMHVSEKAGAEQLLERSDRKRQIDRALMKLEERDRLLLVLYADGLSYREMAEIGSIGLSSVGKLLSRAIQKFKKIAQDEGIDVFE